MKEERKDSLKSKTKSHKTTHRRRITKSTFTRWGKEKDKLAFKLLKSMCKEKDLDITKFIQTEVSKVMNLKTCEFVSNSHKIIVEFIASKYNWIRKPVFLFQRFQKVYSLQNTFSIRELKLLKKILIKSQGSSDWENVIMYHFPGKNKEAITVFDVV